MCCTACAPSEKQMTHRDGAIPRAERPREQPNVVARRPGHQRNPPGRRQGKATHAKSPQPARGPGRSDETKSPILKIYLSFLVDTDICSAYMKGNRHVWQRFMQYRGQLHVSAITVGELFTWTLRVKASPKRLQTLLDLLSDVTVLDVTLDVGRTFGEVRAG